MSDKILLRRGNKADLPALNVGEPGFATDTKEFFIGATGGNVKMASVLSGGSQEQSGSTNIASQSFAANTFYNFPVTFPVPFSDAPAAVELTMNSGNDSNTWINFTAEGITNTGFTIIVAFGAPITSPLKFSWGAK